MICYNQEQYIRTALDSVLFEEVKPYEIIIGDDFSTDGTRAILHEYKAKYPEIIKLILNEKNIGITSNVNNISPRATGDIVSYLSGDDWYRPYLLEKMNKKIVELGLNPNKLRFTLLPHVVIHFPDGSEGIQKNNKGILAKYSAFGSMLRKKMYTRQVGFSRALFEKWPPFQSGSEVIGPWADLVQYSMFAQYMDEQILMDCEGAVYRAGIGITSQTKKEDLERSYQAALVKIQMQNLSGELKLSATDAHYLQFLIQCGYAKLELNYTSFINVFCAARDVLITDGTELFIMINEILCIIKNIVKRRL